MKLGEYRIAAGYSYKILADLFGFTENKTYRLCNDESLCVKLRDANIIVKVTDGEVSLEDLLSGDC